MATEVGSAFVSVLPSARGFGNKLDSEIGGELDGAGKKAGARFGTAMKVGATAAIGGAFVAGAFLKTAVSDASDLAENTSKVGVVFGKQAQQIIAASKSSATAMGLTENAYLGATGTLGNLLVSLDIAPKKAAAMSQEMVKLAGDLASFNNVSPEEALAALQSGLTGETEPLKRFGVNMNEATLKAEALKLGLIKTTKEALDPQSKALAAQSLIMAQTKTAQGDFARTSGGLANQQRILKAQFGDLSATVGKAFLPIATAAVTALNGLLGKASSLGPVLGNVGDVAGKVGDAFGYLFGGDDVRDSANGFAEVMDNVAGNTGNLIGPLEMVGTTIRRVVTFFTEGFRAIVLLFTEGAEGADAFAEVMDFALGNSGKLVAPLRELGTAILGFVDGVQSGLMQVLPIVAQTITGVVIPAVTSLGGYLLTNLLPIFAQVASIVTNNVVPILVALATFFYGTLYPAVIQIVTAIASRLKPVFDQLFATIQDSILPVMQQMLAKFREHQPAIQAIVLALVKVIGKALEFSAAILGKVLPPLIRFVGFIIRNVVPAIGAWIGFLITIIAKVVEFGQKIVGVVAKAAEFVKGVKAKFNEAVTFLTGIPGRVTDALGDLGSLLKDAGKELIQGLIDGITSKLDDLGGAMGKVGGKIKGFLPGSPVKEGPLTSWNRGAAGKRLVDLLAVGLSDTSSVESAMTRLTSRIQIASPHVQLDALGSGLAVSGRSMRPIVVNDRSGSPVQTAKDVARIEAFEGAS